MNNEIKDIYKKASVATICTALFKKGLKNQFIQGVFPLNKKISKLSFKDGFIASLISKPPAEEENSLTYYYYNS